MKWDQRAGLWPSTVYMIESESLPVSRHRQQKKKTKFVTAEPTEGNSCNKQDEKIVKKDATNHIYLTSRTRKKASKVGMAENFMLTTDALFVK